MALPATSGSPAAHHAVPVDAWLNACECPTSTKIVHIWVGRPHPDWAKTLLSLKSALSSITTRGASSVLASHGVVSKFVLVGSGPMHALRKPGSSFDSSATAPRPMLFASYARTMNVLAVRLSQGRCCRWRGSSIPPPHAATSTGLSMTTTSVLSINSGPFLSLLAQFYALAMRNTQCTNASLAAPVSLLQAVLLLNSLARFACCFKPGRPPG